MYGWIIMGMSVRGKRCDWTWSELCWMPGRWDHNHNSNYNNQTTNNLLFCSL